MRPIARRPHRSHRHADTSALAGVFAGIRPRALDPLARHADRLSVPAGTVLARAGRQAHEVVAVIQGEVTALTAEGVERRGPGTWVGADQVLDGTPHPATVVAGAGTEVLVLAAPSFRWAAQVLPGLVAGVRGPATGDGSEDGEPTPETQPETQTEVQATAG